MATMNSAGLRLSMEGEDMSHTLQEGRHSGHRGLRAVTRLQGDARGSQGRRQYCERRRGGVGVHVKRTL